MRLAPLLAPALAVSLAAGGASAAVAPPVIRADSAVAVGTAKPARQKGLEAFLRRYVAANGVAGAATRYAAAFADLDGDGKPEAIVYLSGEGWCGSGGCTTLVLAERNAAWRVVTEITLTHLPIRILASRHHRWRDLAVAIGGGGIQPGYQAALAFNGRRYPDNPTDPRPRKVSGQQGLTLIPVNAPLRPVP